MVRLTNLMGVTNICGKTCALVAAPPLPKVDMRVPALTAQDAAAGRSGSG